MNAEPPPRRIGVSQIDGPPRPDQDFYDYPQIVARCLVHRVKIPPRLAL